MRLGMEEGWCTTPDGARLRTMRWPVSDPRGRVQVVHGLSEHMGRYGLLAEALNRAGYSVWGHDHRGHGRSDGPRGVVGSFDALVEDVGRVGALADTLAPGPGRPFVVAHSLGGLVAIRYLQTRGGEASGALAGAVISAPWLATAVRLSWFHRVLLPVVRRVAADLPIPRPVRGERLTRDPEQIAAYERDPLVVRGLAVSFFDQVGTVQGEALAEGLPVGIPALVLVPEADELTDAEVSAAWASRAGPDVECWRLPETRHEPFNDINRNNTFQRLVEWLDRHADGSVKETE